MSPAMSERVTGWPPEKRMTSTLWMPCFAKSRASVATQSGAWVTLKIVPTRSGASAALAADAATDQRSVNASAAARDLTEYLIAPFLPDLVFQLVARLGHRRELASSLVGGGGVDPAAQPVALVLPRAKHD